MKENQNLHRHFKALVNLVTKTKIIKTTSIKYLS